MTRALRRIRDGLIAAPLLAFGVLLSWLRPRDALRVGGLLGRGWMRLRLPRVGVVRTNLALALPEKDEREREEIARLHFEHLGRTLAEIALLHGPHRHALLEGFRIEGIEHYEAVLVAEEEAGRSGGMLILSAHFGNWELGGLAMANRGYPLAAVHHEIENEAIRWAVQAWRTSTGMETLELGRAGLALFRALSRGQLVALLCDQNAGRDEGAFAPFFGTLASTRYGPLRIAMARGVPLLPVFFYRESTEPLRHVARAFPALELEKAPPGADTAESDEVLRRNLARMKRRHRRRHPSGARAMALGPQALAHTPGRLAEALLKERLPRSCLRPAFRRVQAAFSRTGRLPSETRIGLPMPRTL